MILHFLHWSIVKQRSYSKTLELCYLLYSWGLPLILSIIPLALGHYGPANGWCWIAGTNETSLILLQLSEGFGVIFLVISYNIITLFQIKFKLKQDSIEGYMDETLRKKLLQRLLYYPIVLIVCVLPAALHRILLATQINSSSVAIVAADFQCLLGLGNCIVYGFTDNLKRKIKKRLNMLSLDNPELSSNSIKK